MNQERVHGLTPARQRAVRPRRSRRLVATATSLLLVVSGFVTAGSTGAGAAGVTSVSTCAEVVAAFAAGGEVQLATDIGPCGSVGVGASTAVSLDMNGYTLSITGDAGTDGPNGFDGTTGDPNGSDGGPGTVGEAGHPALSIPAGSSLDVENAGTLEVAGGPAGKSGRGGQGGQGGQGAMGLAGAVGTGGTGGAGAAGARGGAGVSGGGTLTVGSSQVVARGGRGGLAGNGGAGGIGTNRGGQGGAAGDGGTGGAAIDVATVTSTDSSLILTGGPGGFSGMGGSGGDADLWFASTPTNIGGDGGSGGIGGRGGVGMAAGVGSLTGGSTSITSGDGVAGDNGGSNGVSNNGLSGQDGLGGNGGASGPGVDGTALTVADQAATVGEGEVGIGGLGRSGYVASGAHGADVTTGTVVDVTSSGRLEVPSNESLENDGTIDNAGGINSTNAMSRLIGTGTVNNTGSIRSGYISQVDSTQTVTGHNYLVNFASVEGSLSPSSLSVYASTVANGGFGGIPGPIGAASNFMEWKVSGGPLDTAQVDQNTDLSVGGTNVATAMSGAVPISLHAYFAQHVVFTSNAPTNPVVGDSYSPTASGGLSGNPIMFSINQFSTACTISGGTVTFIARGTCVIDADQAAGGYYDAASPAGQSVEVGSIAQSISFTSTVPTGVVPGDTYTVSATGGGSGNPVTFSLDATSTGCTLSEATVTFTGAGTCVIDANQAGNAAYDAAPQVQQRIAIGSSVGGTVTESSSGLPLVNVCVSLWNGNAQLRTTCTGADGTYLMPDVAAGTYTVSFFDPTGFHQTKWAGGATSQGASTPVEMGDQGAVTVDQALSGVPGSISGTVHNDGLDPSTQECVYLYYPGAAGAFAGQGTCTNDAGAYLLAGMAPGSYVVAFVDPMGLTPTIWSGGAATQADATPIIVAADAAVTGVDVSPLPAPGTIVGQVTGSDGMTTLSNICVYAYRYDSVSHTLSSSTPTVATCTNAQGGYVLSGLTTGADATYQLAFVDPTGTYPTQWAVARMTAGPSTSFWTSPRLSTFGYMDLSTTPYGYASPSLFAGGSISGTVRDASTGAPRVGACVYVDFTEDGTYVGQGAVTDANGHYTLTNLAPSQGLSNAGYKVGFYADCSPNQPPTTHWNGGADSEATAANVNVASGYVTNSIDASF